MVRRRFLPISNALDELLNLFFTEGRAKLFERLLMPWRSLGRGFELLE
jgi:hypothetical protein